MSCKRAGEVKDAVLAQALARLGIRDQNWEALVALVRPDPDGYMPDLNDQDWDSLKKVTYTIPRTTLSGIMPLT